jgi:hypothetical protein
VLVDFLPFSIQCIHFADAVTRTLDRHIYAPGLSGDGLDSALRGRRVTDIPLVVKGPA